MIFESALKPSAIVFREEQLFAPWVYALMGLVALRILFPEFGQGGDFHALRLANDPGAYVVLFVTILITACLLKMATEVSPAGVAVSFGWLPIYRTNILLHEIQSAEPVAYRPLRETLGWGIRRNWQGQVVLSARGNRAVKITRRDGSVILIGSQKPEELATIIDSTRRSLMI